MLMHSVKHLLKRFVFPNWDHIHMMVTIMLLYLLKEKKLNSIKHFIPIWITGLLFAEKINFPILSLRYLMQIKMFFIQIRMQIMPKPGILNYSQVSSLNWL